MKRLIEDVEGEGMESLMGEVVTLLCNSYFYTGKLVGVNEACVKLQDPSIVYETGDWADKSWADAQKLPADTIYVQIGHIEAFGVLK